MHTTNQSSGGYPASAKPLFRAFCGSVIYVMHRLMPWIMPRLVGVRVQRVVVIMVRLVIRMVVEDIVGIEAIYQSRFQLPGT